MSRSLWAVFLAAIFVLTGTGRSESRNSSPNVGEVAKPEGLPDSVSATTSGTVSLKLSDLPVGKVIQVGELKFVKVGEDQYLSISPGCVDPVLATTGAQKLLTYTGSYQSYTFYTGCEYQVELWGAQGGSYNNNGVGEFGAYVSGSIGFSSTVTLYVYVGQSSSVRESATFNGTTKSTSGGTPGGGASDIRITNGTWYNDNSLRSRLIVAAGGGSNYTSKQGGAGGGLTGYSSSNSGITNTGGTQISGGQYGKNDSCSGYNANGSFGIGSTCGATGAGGWYGGSGAAHAYGSGAGGSSYISGHTGCVAVTSTSSSSPKSGCTTGTTDNSCSISPYGYTFTETVMIDGAGYQWTNTKGSLKQMPNPTGGSYASGVGHSGNGYARITRLN